MKLAKMSMVAALLLGANAYAIDNVKVNGDAKLYYQTVDSDATGAADAFDSAASAADFALHLGLSADLTEGVSAGVSMTAVSTLGVENNLVNNTWSAAHTPTANPNGGATALGEYQVNDEMWVDEAWLAMTAGKTTAKLGRQAIDTPLVFTETWGIDTNTFEAAVLINQDIADTTLIGAYIGKSNASANDVTPSSPTGHGVAGYVGNGAEFNSFYNGAYAAGIMNNSVKALNLQAWYYDMQTVASAYWLQADVDMEGILAGAQYVNIDADETDDDSAYAVMLGYAMKDTATIKVAYSSVDDKGTTALGGVANTATTVANGGQTKLYTEMWWNYGQVSATGSDSYSVSVEGTLAETDLYLAFYSSETDTVSANDVEVNEIALTASKSYGAFDTTVAVIMDDYDYENVATEDKTDTYIQLYLTYNF